MDIIILCVIGLLAGVLGGLLGVGGSIVMIPALTEIFGPEQHLYQSAAMIVNFFVVVPAFFQHIRAGAVIGAVVRGMAPLAVGGVLVGVLASELSLFKGRGEARLMMVFGAFLLLVAVRMAYRMLDRRSVQDEPDFDPSQGGLRAGLLAGLPTGFVAGLLGVGGGVVCVPLQNRLLGIPLRNAIANSATTIIALSFIGAIGKNTALAMQHPDHTVGESLALAAALIPTAIVGSLLGSRLTHVVPLRFLRLVLIVFLCTAAVRMIRYGFMTLV